METGIFVGVLESEATSRQELSQHPKVALQKIKINEDDEYKECDVIWSKCRKEQLGEDGGHTTPTRKLQNQEEFLVFAQKLVDIGGFIQDLRERGGNPIAPLEATLVAMALKECEEASKR